MPWEGAASCAFVCKFAKDPSTPRSMYFNDVEAHEIATLYARHFNEALPEQYPRIAYVPAFIVEFVDRPGRPVCGCELRLSGGTFKKYNNNVGAVCAVSPEEAADLSRTSTLQNWDPTATAQAFSHFSWEHSGAQVLICDIQGVENRFTDPQIHTMSGKGFGLGNLGQTGIRAFLLRHTCTDLCRAVGLQAIQAKDLTERQVQASFANATGNLAPPGSTSAVPKRHPAAATAVAPSAGSDVLVIGDSPPTTLGRGMNSSASTAYISHQASAAALTGRRPLQQPSSSQSRERPPHPTSQQQATSNHVSRSSAGAHSSRVSSSQSTPAHSPSPSASPRAAAARTLAQTSSAPAPPPKPVGLDETDEALMASIMGD